MKFFKTLYNVFLLHREIRKEAKELSKSLKQMKVDEKTSIEFFNKLVLTALIKIENSQLEDQFKDKFKKAFLANMFDMVRNEYPTLSFEELQKKFRWEKNLFSEMVKSGLEKSGL